MAHRQLFRPLQAASRPCLCAPSTATSIRFVSSGASPTRSSTAEDQSNHIAFSERKTTLQALTPGTISKPRLSTHYNNIVAPDLLYMLYSLPAGHAADGSTSLLETNGRAITDFPDPRSKLPQWKAGDPYAINRPERAPRGGSSALTPKGPVDSSPENLPKLLRITIDIHVPTAISTKKDLLGAILLLQLLTGEPDRAALPDAVRRTLPADKGIRIVKSREKSTSFKVRAGMPCGAVVTLKGPQMYAFLDSLGSFVLPRVPDFLGYPLPPSDANPRTTAMQGGTVSIGLSRDSMGLWPGVEESMENWPAAFGMNIHCVTSARGPKSQERARALLSGFRIPFVRPADAVVRL